MSKDIFHACSERKTKSVTSLDIKINAYVEDLKFATRECVVTFTSSEQIHLSSLTGFLTSDKVK